MGAPTIDRSGAKTEEFVFVSCGARRRELVQARDVVWPMKNLIVACMVRCRQDVRHRAEGTAEGDRRDRGH